ncbi:VOC family protein [Microbacterium sp. NPDC055357]
MQKIVPNIWCNRTAAEAAEFYTRIFPKATSEVTLRYPAEDLPDFQKDFAGDVLTIDVVIDGYHLSLINSDGTFRPNASLSFMVNFDPLMFRGDEAAARGALDALWIELCVGGRVLMELGEYPFSARYGWVEDRYAVTWQLMLTDPEGDPRPFLIPSLLFGATAQNRAAEAVEAYTSIFGGRLGTIVPYPEETGPAAAGAVMFSEFQLAGEWFTAMDSGAPQDSSFTPGVSLEVRCRDQAEIDRLWDALSAVPEAEACGWLVDRFGLSWQITPADMGDRAQEPGVYQGMLDMKKIIIADL